MALEVGGEDVVEEGAEVVVAVFDAGLLEEVEEERSLLSYTIRIPSAFSPPGLVKVATLVLVTPFLLNVTANSVDEGAIQIQKSVDQTSFNVKGLRTQDNVTSLRTGQQVTVVMLFTPVVSWQAVL